MNILTESEIFNSAQMKMIEHKYEASYVCETCLLHNGSWLNFPIAVFYQPDPSKVPAGGSQWFGLYWKYQDFGSHTPPSLRIVNAKSAVEEPFVGIVANNSDVIYSRYRHDLRMAPDKSVWIDGGRDYTRSSEGPIVPLAIVEDRLEIIGEPG